MPTYSYACTQCDNRFDIVQSFSDATLTVCELCQGRLRKVFDSVGVVFKGSGFYRTDARGSGGSGAKASGKTSGESSTGSASTSAPTSPASSGTASSGTASSGTTSSSGSSAAAPASAG